MNDTKPLLATLVLVLGQVGPGTAVTKQSRVEAPGSLAIEQSDAKIEFLNRYGLNALLQAVAAGRTRLAKELLNDAVAIDARDEYGQTPLMLTTDPELCAQLIAHGADVNATTTYGRTPLMMAVWYIRNDLLPVLIDAGADVSARDRGGDSALTVAASRGESRAIELLIAAGGDANERIVEGITILMRAASYGHLNNVRTLIRAGADVSLTDQNGKTALDYARETRHDDIAQLLETDGSNHE